MESAAPSVEWFLRHTTMTSKVDWSRRLALGRRDGHLGPYGLTCIDAKSGCPYRLELPSILGAPGFVYRPPAVTPLVVKSKPP